jgi:hypothetical protein
MPRLLRAATPKSRGIRHAAMDIAGSRILVVGQTAGNFESSPVVELQYLAIDVQVRIGYEFPLGGSVEVVRESSLPVPLTSQRTIPARRCFRRVPSLGPRGCFGRRRTITDWAANACDRHRWKTSRSTSGSWTSKSGCRFLARRVVADLESSRHPADPLLSGSESLSGDRAMQAYWSSSSEDVAHPAW